MGGGAVEVVWLQALPDRVQDRYFEARRRSYNEIWGRRGVEIEDGFGLRDEFDTDAVVAAVRGDEIVGGVRANIVRPAQSADVPVSLLPMEKIFGVDLRNVYPDHGLDTVAYAEASRLFLFDAPNLLQATALKLRLLDYLLENVPGVAATYFVLPATLLRTYRLLARHKRIAHDFRLVEGLHPNASATGDKPTQWGVFACLHAAS
jgi:hypothetical protein